MVGIPFSPSKRGAMAGEATTKSYREVAAKYKCSISTVAYAVRQRRLRGTNTSPKRPGRPQTLSPRAMAHLRRIITKNRRLSLRRLLPLLSEHNLAMSLSTLKRVFQRLGLMRYIARFKPFVNKRAKLLRCLYSAKHQKDGLQDWRRTIFVDEASMRLDGHCRTYVTRASREAYREDCLFPRLHALRGSCMVWAAIWHGGRSELIRFDHSESEGKRSGVTAVIYRDQITKGELRRNWREVCAWWRGYGRPRIVEDGARVHTSPVNRIVGAKQGFRYLDHPPYSPDLNPIENCWALMKRKLSHMSPRPTTIDGMFAVAKDIWRAIPQAHIDATVDSMPWRLKEVKKRRGLSLPC